MVENLHKQIYSNVDTTRSILNKLETLDKETKAQYNQDIETRISWAQTALQNARTFIYNPFRSQDPESPNPLVSLKKFASWSNKLLDASQKGDITAIQTCLRLPALDIACQNLVKSPPHEIQPIKFQRDDAAELLAQIIDNKGQGALVADIDYTLINTSDPDRRSVMPEDFIKNARELRQHKATVAPISGREMGAILPSLKNGGADQTFIDNLEIYSEYGAVHRGPSTNGQEIVTDKQAEKYVSLAKEVLDTIEKRIKDDPQLKELTQQQDLPPIGMIRKTLGGVIQGVPQRERLENYLKKQGLSEKEVEEKVSFVYQRLYNIALATLKEKPEYKAFHLKDTKITGIDLRLDADTTGLELNKGTALASLIKRLKLKSVAIFGDDRADLEMTKVALRYIAANKYVRDYASESETRVETLTNKMSKTNTQLDSHLANADKQKASEARNKLNEEFVSRLRNRLESQGITLESQAFVGVERPKGLTEDEVREAAAFMVDSTDSAVNIIREITKKIVNANKNTENL
jgi:hydroxymethylpyrimidine pyrophosphatase-like HAD family hydrolase